MEENPVSMGQPASIPTAPEPVGEQPVPHEVPKNKSKTGWIPGLLIFVLLLFVAYLYYQNAQLKKELEMVMLGNIVVDTEVSVTPTTNPIVDDDRFPPPPTDPTAGWEKFDAEEYSLSFAFPPNFIAREEKTWVDEIGGETKITGYTVVWEAEEVLDRRWMHIKKIETGSHEETLIQPFLKLNIGETYNKEINPKLSPVPYTRKQDLIMGDNWAMVFEAPGEWEIQGEVKKVLVQNNGEYYEAFMTYSNYESRDIDYPSTFDQILSTFKFTE